MWYQRSMLGRRRASCVDDALALLSRAYRLSVGVRGRVTSICNGNTGLPAELAGRDSEQFSAMRASLALVATHLDTAANNFEYYLSGDPAWRIQTYRGFTLSFTAPVSRFMTITTVL